MTSETAPAVSSTDVATDSETPIVAAPPTNGAVAHGDDGPAAGTPERALYDDLREKNITGIASAGRVAMLRKFREFIENRGLTLETAPANLLQEYGEKVSGWKLSGQNRAAAQLLAHLDVVRKKGHKVAAFTWTRVEPPPPVAAPPAPPLPNGADLFGDDSLPQSPAPRGRMTDTATSPIQFGAEPLPPSQPQGGPVIAPPPPVQRPQPRAAPAQPSLFPVGSRIRVCKRATGFEGTGVAPGSLISIGNYLAAEVSRTGTMQDFIERYVVPAHGPLPGSPDMVYVAQVLDARGNVTAEYEYPMAAPLSNAPGTAMPPTSFGPLPPNIRIPDWQRQRGVSDPRTPEGEQAFLQYLTEKHEKLEEKYNKLVDEARQRNNGNIDMTTLLLLERQKPEPPDLDKALQAYRAKMGIPADPGWDTPVPPRRQRQLTPEFDDLLGTPLAVAGPPPVAPPVQLAPQPNPMEPVAQALAGVTNLLSTMATQTSQRPAPEKVGMDPFVVEMIRASNATQTALMTALFENKKGGTDDAIVRMIEKQNDRMENLMKELAKPPEKSRSMGEQLGDMKELAKTYREILGSGGEEGPHPVVETIGVIMENLDKLAPIAAMFTGKAPQLQTPQKQLGAGQQPAQGQQQAGPVTLSKAGQAAVLAIAKAAPNDDQTIFEGVFELMKALNEDKNPHWQKLLVLFRDGFLAADSKPELRALVTNLFSRVGARKLAQDEATVEKVTRMLHGHYSEVHKMLAGGKEKTLADAVPAASPGATTAPPPSPQAKQSQPAAEPAIAEFDVGVVAEAPPKASPPTIEGTPVAPGEDDAGGESDDPDEGDDDSVDDEGDEGDEPEETKS